MIRFYSLFFLLFILSCRDNKSVVETYSNPKLAALQLPEGFRADHLFGPSENGEGSWVAMTFDNKGRLIASDQYGALYRMTIPVIGDTVTKLISEPLRIPSTKGDTTAVSNKIDIGYAHGLLYAFNSLYVMVNHYGDSSFPKGSGLYRLKDTDNDDQYDSITLLKSLQGDGEHGPHSIVLSPDKQSLFVIAGNFTKLPKMDAYRNSPDAEIDNLLPMIKDPNGHDNEVGNQGGWIAKLDSTGSQWELYASGFRNPFDLAFNDAGDLFTYDSDMEWDMGTPWYRPTRICHVTSGSEFGWRPGTGKWNPGFADGRPALLNIGQGSPTNLVYGSTARFPEKYRKALFAFDWSFGIVYSIHLEQSGSTYKAKGEEFLSGSPLPLTDGVIGPDGALYFLTGGRRLESDLYRVYYGDGKLPNEPLPQPVLNEDHQIRRKLEALHSAADKTASKTAWTYLNHSDEAIRFAARKILEKNPLSDWEELFMAEPNAGTRIQAMLAIAKKSVENTEWTTWISNLHKLKFEKLSTQEKLDLVRAMEISASRTTLPEPSVRNQLIDYFGPAFPVEKEALLNRQLSKLLIYLGDSAAIQKSLDLLFAEKELGLPEEKNLTSSEDLIMRNPDYGMSIATMLAKLPPQNQTFYATVLSQVRNGWTENQLEQYFKWFSTAFQYNGGYSYAGFINRARKNALAALPKDKFRYFNELSGDSIAERPPVMQTKDAVQPKGPGRDWTVEEAMKYVDSGMGNRNFETGKGLFVSSLCASCHSMQGQGGVSGPDLTQIGSRFTYRDMLEAIIEPGKVISDQYGATVFYLKSGKSVIGRQISFDESGYTIAQNPFAPQEHRLIPKEEVIRTRVSEISPMLPGMINRLNAQELKDLLAFLKSGGNSKDSLFTSAKK
jgi:putative heme-binding domain-containing protein